MINSGGGDNSGDKQVVEQLDTPIPHGLRDSIYRCLNMTPPVEEASEEIDTELFPKELIENFVTTKKNVN